MIQGKKVAGLFDIPQITAFVAQATLTPPGKILSGMGALYLPRL
jgi:hypothetical protein